MSELFSIQRKIGSSKAGMASGWTCLPQPNRYKQPCGKSAFRPIIRRAFSFPATLPRKKNALQFLITWCWHPMWTS